MKVIVNPLSGFCPGVNFAEKKLFKTKQKHPDRQIQIYGELIHNKDYINYLKEKNINTVYEIKDFNRESIITIRTHGIPKKTEKEIKKYFSKILDLTCVKVKKLQLTVEKYSKNGYFIIITGKKNHPEVLGLTGYAKDSIVFESIKKIDNYINNNPEKLKEVIKSKGYKKILLCSQTTSTIKLFEYAKKSIKKNYKDIFKFKYINSICPITSLREDKALELQKATDASFVIGDRSSSNANKLYNILKNSDKKNTYFITNVKDLKNQKINLSQYKIVQVVSSSSTPDFIEKQVIKYLENH